MLLNFRRMFNLFQQKTATLFNGGILDIDGSLNALLNGA